LSEKVKGKVSEINLWNYSSPPKVTNRKCPKCSSDEVYLSGTFRNKEQKAWIRCKECNYEWQEKSSEVEIEEKVIGKRYNSN